MITKFLKLITTLVLFIGINIQPVVNAQESYSIELTPKIEVTKDKFVTIVFPSDILRCHAGFDPDKFVIKQSKDILTLQPLIPFAEETNIMIETIDGSIYLIDLVYVTKIPTTFFKFTKDLAKGDRELDREENSDTPTAGDTYQNQKKDKNLLTVAKLSPYITINNGTRLKNIEAYVKGIFIKDENLYFQIQFINGSDIQYNFDFIGFSAVTKVKKGMSIERSELPIIETFIPERSLGKGQINIVVKLSKFTLSSNKLLLIELFEGAGERNLSINIDHTTLLMAKTF